MSPELFLSVQYGAPAPELPRWRLRRWVQRSVACIASQALPGPDSDTAGTQPTQAFSAVALTLRLVDADEGRELNQQYRHRDYATNVLTFEYGKDPTGMITADVVMCLPVLQREALEQGKPLLHHAAHLTVHGVLHALGYDHIEPADAALMESLETNILKKFGIPDPYQQDGVRQFS
jgi:probable rRNA maturation factor